jgi:hypothetical protein
MGKLVAGLSSDYRAGAELGEPTVNAASRILPSGKIAAYHD